MIRDLQSEYIPLSTQSLSCWLLSPWMPIAGHLKQENPMNSHHFRPKLSNYDSEAEQAILPIPTHPPGEIVTPFLGLHKNNGLVLLLAHDFLQQAHQSEKKKTLIVMHFLTQPTNQAFNVPSTHLSSFSPSLQTSTICRMLWLALSCRAPTLICT